MLREIEEHCVFEDPEITVEQLLQSWLAHTAPIAAAQPISPKTHERYVSIVRNQLIPHLGMIPLRKLNPRHITEMQTALRQRGLSGTTCLHVHRVLHTALNFGVKNLRVVKSKRGVRGSVTQSLDSPARRRRAKHSDALGGDDRHAFGSSSHVRGDDGRSARRAAGTALARRRVRAQTAGDLSIARRDEGIRASIQGSQVRARASAADRRCAPCGAQHAQGRTDCRSSTLRAGVRRSRFGVATKTARRGRGTR